MLTNFKIYLKKNNPLKQRYTAYIALFFLIYTGESLAQLKTLRASLSSSVSDAHVIQVGNFKVQQSIGQTGITGAVNHRASTVIRGFLLPQNIFTSKPNVPDFDLLVYPNPFVDYIDLSFSKTVSGNMLFRLHDVTGRLIFEQTSLVKQNQRIELGFLAQAEYILSVEVMGKRFSQNLLNYNTSNKEQSINTL